VAAEVLLSAVSFDSVNAVSDPYARIFLLSHMRAFTSLAGHILGSHPQINGWRWTRP